MSQSNSDNSTSKKSFPKGEDLGEAPNKRIAKNTLMLYIRMLLSMVVSLYTSRVVLEVLGVEDYGIYGVVGGVVAMFSFLNAAMSSATSRFLTFEMGRGDEQRLKDTFSSALIIHIGIALVVFALAETVGLWFLNNKLVIPDGRMYAAHWVYQCSIISTMLAITQVPYNASIIAHEKMDVYAYVEILNTVLKLLIVYVLLLFDFDKLKFYSILMLFVSIIVIMTYRIYCLRNFSESHFRFVWKKEIIRPMLSFSGWNFYGNMCVTARQQGTNFLINIFFGVVANAASSIATTVNGVLTGFAYNVITAFRPGIIKSYSLKKWDEMKNLTNNAIVFSSLLFVMIVIPCFLEIPFLIDLWLGSEPEYVSMFIRITFISNIFAIITSVFNTGIQATGKMKKISLSASTVFLLSLPVSYVLLHYGYKVEIVYIINLCSVVIVLLINVYLFYKYLRNVDIREIIINILKVLLVSILTGLVIYMVSRNIQQDFLRLVVCCLMSVLMIAILSYIIVLNKVQREYVSHILMSKLCRKRQ